MALAINPQLSPRLITVLAPDTEITVQELVDQLRDWEDDPGGGMTYPSIISAAGKEALGGGVSVGITATLQNAQLSFEDRPDPQESGTVTTQDLTGLVLTDSTALFQTNGVLRGATVYNRTSGATGTVLTVDSETQLTLAEALDGGDDIEFALGDSYSCHNTIQCDISGGNLVAVDDLGAELDPIFPTAFTQVVRTASSSATISNIDQIETDVASTLALVTSTDAKVDIAVAILRNKTITDPVTGVMTVYAEDGTTPLYTAQMYQDAAGAQTYQGQGAERRERIE